MSIAMAFDGSPKATEVVPCIRSVTGREGGATTATGTGMVSAASGGAEVADGRTPSAIISDSIRSIFSAVSRAASRRAASVSGAGGRSPAWRSPSNERSAGCSCEPAERSRREGCFPFRLKIENTTGWGRFLRSRCSRWLGTGQSSTHP